MAARGLGAGPDCDAPDMLGLNQAVSQSESHRLKTAVDPELGEDLGDVISGGGRTDAELLGDRLG